jgi:hypothetical protein
MSITIDFQEGFKDDEIIVYENKKKVFQTDDNVSTRMQIGLAKSVQLDTKNKKANIKVEIPSRNISETKEVELTDDLRIGVSLTEDNKLEWKFSDAPFMYM